MPGFETMTTTQLARLIGTPQAPVLLDCRTDEDFAQTPALLPTARRLAHDQAAATAADLAGQHVVTICHKGQKISEGVAAILRNAGARAEVLQGGACAWHAAGLPMIPAAALPRTRYWVTRHRPKIDRIACAWLLRRFVDRDAQILYVAPAEVRAVADKFGAEPFDIEEVKFSHRGELCSFDVMLEEFTLRTKPLDRMALVIRGADTNRHDLAPQAAGLLAISVGLSRQYKDDLAQLEAGMVVYDALYRWARDGFDEGHDWPAPAPRS